MTFILAFLPFPFLLTIAVVITVALICVSEWEVWG